MKLSLDHMQRLNLHALMGAQKVNLDDMRMLWKLQDRLDLSEEERQSIGWKTISVNGLEQVAWDTRKALPGKDFEFSAEEFNRISRMLKEWQPGFLTQGDRQWLEPLLAQLENHQDGAQ